MKAIVILLLGTTVVAFQESNVYQRANDDGNPLEHWPELCNTTKYRNKQENKVWEKGNLGGTLKIIATTGDAYEKYVENGANKVKSFPRFVADSLNYNYNWDCNDSKCEIGEAAGDKCTKTKTSAYNFLYLESALNYWDYMDSFKKAIDDARDYISGQIPAMFDDFGDEVNDDEGWSEPIGILTGVAGIFASFLPGPAGLGADIGLSLIDTFAGSLIPEQDSEQKFEKFKDASKIFSNNVDKITTTINDHINKEFEQPLEWEGTGINALTPAIMNDPMFKAINTGDFAGRDTPSIDLKDRGIRGSLAAPVINAIWRRAKNYVIRFDGKGFKDAGIDLCAEDAFPGLRASDDFKIGCGDGDNSLYMIAHWGRDAFADVQGIDRLDDFKLSRADIIAGAIKNHDIGGFDYKPGAEELFNRVKESNHDSPTNGLANVWNMPFCVVGPRAKLDGGASLETKLAISALGCIDFKDKNGKSWPYGKQ